MRRISGPGAEQGTRAEVSEGPITGGRDTGRRGLGALFSGTGGRRAFLGTARSARARR
ncbi:hypothetical protein [Nocardiopsis sp. FR26]|uniref:hypothetical protein n=1 Tax=Nocardiopsis sp. FR26 TaxID=2605987 RepID=UPI0013572A68|nr:hypothetical protein [Nocardiopsis sp. FR26]